MYEKKMLGVEEALRTVEAMIEENKRMSGLPIAIAIVDDRGDLICFARMDEVPSTGKVQGYMDLASTMAIKKAYSAAHWKRNTLNLAERMRELEITVADAFGPQYTALAGGVAIVKPGEETVYGAIGVGGRIPGSDDELMAQYGLEVIQSILWPST